MKGIRSGILVLAAALLALAPLSARAALSFNVDANGWPNATHRTAAVNAMTAVVNRYNAYSNNGFGNYNVYVYYNAGIPTAQASYGGFGGSIGFGGTYPNERVTLHEMAHYLGSGTYGDPWDGAYGEAQVDQFDGIEATLNGDSAHFWPYGLNFDSEFSEIAAQRAVAMIYAQRADMGIGPTTHPSTATAVTMTASDPVGESGFNYKARWSDGYWPHAGAAYTLGANSLRTPESGNSFHFGGDSLTLNSPSAITGLWYRGTGATGVISFNNLILAGGWVDHRGSVADVFKLDGKITVQSASNIRALLGNIDVLADIAGAGTLTIHPTQIPGENNRYVRFKSPDNTFVGSIVNNARFELSPGANFKFALGAVGVNNVIGGGAALVTALNGAFTFDVTNADYDYGNSWTLVTAANTTYGATFNLPGFTNNAGVWHNGSFTFNQATGALTVAPGSDLNGDSIVNLNDWATFIDNHLGDLSPYTPAQRAARGDLNGDGKNDHADFLQFAYQYDALNGAGSFAAMYSAFVPEPAGAALALCSALALAAFRRRSVTR